MFDDRSLCMGKKKLTQEQLDQFAKQKEYLLNPKRTPDNVRAYLDFPDNDVALIRYMQSILTLTDEECMPNLIGESGIPLDAIAKNLYEKIDMILNMADKKGKFFSDIYSGENESLAIPNLLMKESNNPRKISTSYDEFLQDTEKYKLEELKSRGGWNEELLYLFAIYERIHESVQKQEGKKDFLTTARDIVARRQPDSTVTLATLGWENNPCQSNNSNWANDESWVR